MERSHILFLKSSLFFSDIVERQNRVFSRIGGDNIDFCILMLDNIWELQRDFLVFRLSKPHVKMQNKANERK